MLPSIVATQIRNCVADYLQTTFRPTTPGFQGLMERFIQEPENYHKGPYITLGLPFRSGTLGANYFPDIPLTFNPHLHQERAFQRLAPPHYRSTLIATGTGSGKTECFLIPLLEHCRQHSSTPGIKAILIYPMNALATDQAKRIAALIHNTPTLKGKITAGLYVGDQDDHPTQTMGPDQIITDKSTLRSSPPHLLLTNYKMLDYLLIQPETQPLWQHNQDNPETLRYIVVDEFHTFDGAQGTDLACLLRRLKYRLKTPPGHLACVGTSATLGSKDNQGEMLDYAHKIFAEPFDAQALIEEDRLSAREFLDEDPDALINVLPIPDLDQWEDLLADRYHSPEAYLQAQVQLWLHHLAPNFEDDRWPIILGKELKNLPIVRNLVKQLRDGSPTYNDLLSSLSQRLGIDTSTGTDYPNLLLDSLLSLMAAARREVPKPDGTALVLPWVSLRVQYWFRELHRMVATVEAQPDLQFSSDLTTTLPEPGEIAPPKALPVLNCRDCGATGWGGLLPHSTAQKLESAEKLSEFYQAYFSRKPLVVYLFPYQSSDPELSPALHRDKQQKQQLCGQCLRLNSADRSVCQDCGSDQLVPVLRPLNTCEEQHQEQKITKLDHSCPYCNGTNGMTIVGARAASLTSAMIGVLYTTPFNRDKKLLTFSDSVQDAAHRAGFFGARTYRTTLRTAIYKLLAEAVPDNPKAQGVSLQALVDRFPDYWPRQLGSIAAYVATFLPTDLAWLQEWDSFLKGTALDLPPDSRLPQLLHDRLTWEIVNQFGHRSAVGPSLERSEACSVAFNPSALQIAVNTLHLRLSNEIEALRTLTPSNTKQFLLGLLHHLRQQGGLLQPVTETYIQQGGKTYLWSKLTFMPKVGPGTPRPRFYVSQGTKTEGFEPVIRADRRQSWCEDWTQRIFAPTGLVLKEQLPEILGYALAALEAAGLLQTRPCNTGQAWGIPLDQVHLYPDGTVFRCDRCSHQLTVSLFPDQLFYQMRCLSLGCAGHYQPDNGGVLTYYRQVYRHGEVQRIVAAEHTGLLSRTNRERLEQQFIQGDRRCDPNLISATSTLEMGIDIGDLSTVFLTSVPPGTANFQQRIGRAGRRDGNALVSILANGKPHDLYFYARPDLMLAGKVEPAGCYLDASAILQRQLTAFCLDRWIATGVSRSAFPRLLSPVLNAIERKDQDRFPYNWLTYIQRHQAELLETFLTLFADCTEDRTREELRVFMDKGEQDEGGLRYRILNALQIVRAERTRLSNQITSLTKKLKQLKQAPEALQDPDRLEELEKERAGFRGLMQAFHDKLTLNFFTDEGLLPNYAFPEAGVTLKSILWRRRETSEAPSGKKYESYPVSYERPSRLAIRELVPKGVFYAEGRRVTIDQIDLKLSEPQEWRFCRNCNHALPTLEPAAKAPVCPRCQDPMWNDQGQVHRMLRLKQVMATTSDRASRFGDDSDDRSIAFFQRHLLVDFEPDAIEKTFRVKDDTFPFGFEYISRTRFREINLGEPSGEGQGITLGGQKYKSQGFRICRNCGKVMHGNSKRDHTIGCQFRETPDQAKALDVLYLYREFESESIRFLMPDDNFWTPAGLHSFVAALQLGLKQKFGGQVGHLQITINEEPQLHQTQQSLRKSFLYLFDLVPGGTGYLRQLIRDPAEMRDIFDRALKVVRACSCRDSDANADGCYKCLFAYRNSFDQDRTSRKLGQQLLHSILHHWPQLQETSTGLSAVKLNSNFESELERRFIEAIKRYKLKDPNQHSVKLRKEAVNGKTGYYLKIGSSAWVIEPQVYLGAAEGVGIPSRADFLIRSASRQTTSRAIAVFTDGWEYHKDRIGEDLEQRLAILRSNQFWCWSLTWDDIAQQLDPGLPIATLNGLTQHLNLPFQSNAAQVYQQYRCESMAPLEQQNSFEWLMHYLANPSSTLWQQWASLRTMAQVQGPSWVDRSRWLDQIRPLVGDLALDYWGVPDQFLNGQIQISKLLTLYTAADLKRHQQSQATGQGLAMGSFILLQLDDTANLDTQGFKQSWNELLRLLNLYQFLPHTYALTTTTQQGYQPFLPHLPADQSSTLTAQSTDQDWSHLRELILEDRLLPAIDTMAQQHWPLPEVGYELSNDQGTIIAELELAWPASHFGIAVTDETLNACAQTGWSVFTVEQFLTSIDQIRTQLQGA